MANRASLSYRDARLSTEFGESYARKLFGDATIDALPKYVRGKNAGKIKGTIVWTKVERGGWIGRGADDCGALGYVENRVGKVISATLHEPAPWRSDLPYGHEIAKWERK